MKRLFIVLIVVLFSVLAPGQAPFPSKDEIKQFSVSKTCVVLEDDLFSSFNAYIKDAMKEYWKVTQFEFISVKDFNVMRLKPAYSFIVLTQTNYEKDKSRSVFNFINLLQGKEVDKLGEMPEICAVPLSFAGEDDIEYGYKLGAILSFMQKHAQLIMEDPSKTGRKYLKFYNENVPEVMKKTILVKQEDLSPEINTIDKIKAIYSNKIEIVSEEDIVKAIENKTPNTVILHKVGPVGEKQNEGYCFKMLIGTDDANMYYYNLHTINKDNPNGFLSSDLKRLARFD
jgi:sulfite reductase alpha subunit-like flavoprotein